MIQLYDAEKGDSIGAISDAQLQRLVDSLGEESPTDQDYYLTSATINLLEDDGADPECASCAMPLAGAKGWTSAGSRVIVHRDRAG
jgi:hypothetical protein